MINDRIYLVSCVVETSGGGASGFETTAGITTKARTLEDAGTVLEVFRSTSDSSLL